MGIEEQITEIIEKKLVGYNPRPEPDLITIKEAQEICKCGREAITSLFNDRHSNGFPGVQLSARTLRIDRNRLFDWIAKGGLTSV